MHPIAVFYFLEYHLKTGKECWWPCKLKARMCHGIPLGSSKGLPKPSDDEHHPPFKTGYKIKKKLVKIWKQSLIFKRDVWNR